MTVARDHQGPRWNGPFSSSSTSRSTEEGLPEADVLMLASIEFRGEAPRTKERWRYIYNAIETSRGLDRPRRK